MSTSQKYFLMREVSSGKIKCWVVTCLWISEIAPGFLERSSWQVPPNKGWILSGFLTKFLRILSPLPLMTMIFWKVTGSIHFLKNLQRDFKTNPFESYQNGWSAFYKASPGRNQQQFCWKISRVSWVWAPYPGHWPLLNPKSPHFYPPFAQFCLKQLETRNSESFHQ